MERSARTELLIPIPEKSQTSARASLFFDLGNVFSNDGTKYLGEDLETPVKDGDEVSIIPSIAGGC